MIGPLKELLHQLHEKIQHGAWRDRQGCWCGTFICPSSLGSRLDVRDLGRANSWGDLSWIFMTPGRSSSSSIKLNAQRKEPWIDGTDAENISPPKCARNLRLGRRHAQAVVITRHSWFCWIPTHEYILKRINLTGVEYTQCTYLAAGSYQSEPNLGEFSSTSELHCQTAQILADEQHEQLQLQKVGKIGNNRIDMGILRLSLVLIFLI